MGHRRPRPGGGDDARGVARGAAAAAIACPDLHQRRPEVDRVLRAHARSAPVGPRLRSRRLHARHPRQRPSPAGAGEVVGAGLPPLLVGRDVDQRHRSRRDAHARQGLPERLGLRASRARFELLPLHHGSVGLVRRILLRHRLHPEGRPLAGRRPQAGRLVLSVGAGRAARIHPQRRGGRAVPTALLKNGNGRAEPRPF